MRTEKNSPASDTRDAAPSQAAPTALVVDTVASQMLPLAVFTDAGLAVQQAEDLETAHGLLRRDRPRMVFTQLLIRGKSAQGLVAQAAAMRPRPMIVVVATNDQINAAAEAMRTGADDCLFWPFSEQRLAKTIAMARDAWGRPQAGQASSPETQPSARETSGLTGPSARIRAVLRHVDILANSDIGVLLAGAAGSGRAQLAQYLHDHSPRASATFVRIDCAALTPQDSAKTLFGPGGAFSQAAQGTLFFENLDDCAPAVQEALAHHFEMRARKGTAQAGPRLAASTSAAGRDLLEGARIDATLCARLCEATVQVPALRDRREDIAPLVARIRAEAAQTQGAPVKEIETAALAWLESRTWPGNLAQLTEVTTAALSAEPGPKISKATVMAAYDALPPRNLGGNDRLASVLGLVGKSLEEIEEIVIEATIQAEAGSLPRAAAVLGVSPSTLYRKRAAWARRGGGGG